MTKQKNKKKQKRQTLFLQLVPTKANFAEFNFAIVPHSACFAEIVYLCIYLVS